MGIFYTISWHFIDKMTSNNQENNQQINLIKNNQIMEIIIICVPKFKSYRDWPVSPPPIQAARRWTSGFLRPQMRTWPPAGSEPWVAAGARHRLLPPRPQLPAASAPATGHCLWLSEWCALPRCCPGPGRSGLSCRRWSTAVWGRPAPLEGRTLWWCETKIYSYWRGDRLLSLSLFP